MAWAAGLFASYGRIIAYLFVSGVFKTHLCEDIGMVHEERKGLKD